MCGIAGIVGLVAEPNRRALKRMNDAMTHRGPDGEGFWEAQPDERGWGALLAHRRLAILDLSPAGAQPMVDPTSGDVVVLNGEIYNYVELRNQLTAVGHRLRSSGDTAVMLRVLSLHGRNAVAMLRGMFAFAFWDTHSRRLTVARDALGIKPLYMARNRDPDGDWSVLFASELRAILASGLLGKPRLNPQAAASVVWNGFMVTPDTAIKGIESVMPGELRVFDGHGREETRVTHWRLPERDGDGAVGEDQLAKAFESSVRLHLASDVPLAVFLSGGIDSSAIANVAHRVSGRPVHTFTLALEEQEHNEGVSARRIATAIGTQHHELVLTEQRFLSGLEGALDSLDQPTFDGLNSYFMAQAVSDAGFTVALVGSGGDELFGGYKSFHDLPKLLRAASWAKWVPKPVQLAAARFAASVMQRSGGNFPPQTRWAKLPEMIRHGDDLLALYQMAYALFLSDYQRQLLGDAAQSALVSGLPPAMHERLREETRLRTPLSAISVMEQRIFLGERLLRDTDSAGMAASIEIRLPLVDQVFLRQVDCLPQAARFEPVRAKSVLRRIGLRGLDPALFNRPKAGFTLPYDRWLHSALGKKIDGTMRDEHAIRRTGLNPDAVRRLWQAYLDGAPGLYWSRVWAIYVFVRWCERHELSL